jgi:K+-transporting ATPase ATPase A chain
VTLAGWIQIAFYFAVLVAITKPLGLYIHKVFAGERTWLSPGLRPIEAGLYRVSGVDENQEQSWLRYAIAVLLFSVVGMVVVYALQRLQGDLPLNPAGMPGVKEDSAFNTAASFTTNTNWQGYAASPR